MKTGALCMGIGGLEIAVESVFDAHPAWCCEIDSDASAVIAHRWPGLPNHGDLTAVNWKEIAAMSKHELAQEMYDRYCQGLSLERVANEFGRSRQTVYKMFSRRGWSMRPRPPAKEYVEFGSRSYSLGLNGYYRATGGDRGLMHRHVWERHRHALPDDWDVHHLDHDKTNNDIANLEALPKDEHTRRHHAEAKGVMPDKYPAIDILTAGYP